MTETTPTTQTAAATAWSWVQWAYEAAWNAFVSAIVASPQIAAVAILALGGLVLAGKIDNPLRYDDQRVNTRIDNLTSIMGDWQKELQKYAAKADQATLEARLSALERKAPLTTGSISKPAAKK